MRYRRESGKLVHHKDTVSCLAFSPEGSHLFSCSNDGSITVVRCGNWQIEKIWPVAHKGMGVNTLAIHPTGKLALSTGEDGVLRTWNLIKGRQAYATNLVPKLKSNAKWITIIKWSPNGEKYLLAVNENIYIYSVETAGIDRELTFNSKVICVEFLKDNLIAVGFENGEIKFCDLKTSLHTINMKAHDMRVKCIAHMNDLLVSASSSGEIKLWKYNKRSLNILQTVNCGARITCLSLAQTYKDLMQQKENTSEKEKKIKTTKLRLKQEVIIEDEEDLDVSNPRKKTQKKKQGKKRAIEDVEDNVEPTRKKVLKVNEIVISKKKRDRSLQMENINKPTKKKKLLKKIKTTLYNKKRKENSAASQITSPAKKIKKLNKVEELPLSHKKHKIKLPMEDIKDVLPKKIKKISMGKGTILRKKKKKIIG
ncbi:hypothetical protein PUN28_000270 [Cardiocondyla obscurior]